MADEPLDDDQDDVRSIRTITTSRQAEEDAAGDRPLVKVKLDDKVIEARRPKESVMGWAAGVMSDKYADPSRLARAAFEFLEAALEPKSWVHVMDRLKDRDDHFDTEGLGALFEGLMDEFLAQVEGEAPNRAARRAPRKAPARSNGSRRG